MSKTVFQWFVPSIGQLALQGIVRRRILVNFRVDPEVIQRLLPEPFRPKLVGEWAMAGICLIRLEQLRPRGLPAAIGVSSENAAHRIAVTWDEPSGEQREGVYIPRRDSGSLLNHVVGGCLFPVEQRRARFQVRDTLDRIDLKLETEDGGGDVWLRARASDGLPNSSLFASLDEASSFFRRGALGFSPTTSGPRLDGVRLSTRRWQAATLDVEWVVSTYFADTRRFPPGSVEYDCMLLMRDIPHEWHPVPEPCTPAADCVA
jgi:hypothetical protein